MNNLIKKNLNNGGDCAERKAFGPDRGGGTAGITVAASLRRRAPRDLDIAIVEPASSHYYQPAWTLVGGGVYPMEKTRRQEASLFCGALP